MLEYKDNMYLKYAGKVQFDDEFPGILSFSQSIYFCFFSKGIIIACYSFYYSPVIHKCNWNNILKIWSPLVSVASTKVTQ